MKFVPSESVSKLKGSKTAQMMAMAKKLDREGKDLVHFEVGQPDFPVPDVARTAMANAAAQGNTGYTIGRGIPELRQAIADLYQRRDDVHVDSKSEILAFPGAKFGIFAFLFSTLNRGDEVIIPNPSWVSYPDITLACGGVPGYVPLHKDWSLDMAAIENATTAKTKVVIINTPGNPTGAVFNKKNLEELREWALANNVMVLSDEIYSDFVFERTHESVMQFEDFRDWSVVLNGFSKSYAMTGLRLGYLIGQEEIMNAMNKIIQNTVTCPNSMTQWGTIPVLDNHEEIMRPIISSIGERRKRLMEMIRTEIPSASFSEPHGAFYVMLGYGLAKNSETVSTELMQDDYLVATTPGSAFGPAGENANRLAYCRPKEEIEEGIQRIGRYISDQS